MNNEASNNIFGIFEFHPDGFTIVIQKEKRKITWDEIESLNAYKLDLMAFDEVCLDIVLEKKFITVTEKTDGWNEFLKKLQLQFPSIEKDWDMRITQPPFVTNFITLFTRNNS